MFPPQWTQLCGGRDMQVTSHIAYWSKACKMNLLVQPSSAAAERVFLFYQTFLLILKGPRWKNNYIIETSIMMQYNNKD